MAKSYLKGFMQAHDFGNIPGASGSFILAYPDKMKDAISRRLKDSSMPESALQGFKFRGLLLMRGEQAEPLFGTIDEVAQRLKDGIQQRPRRDNAGAFISLMRDIVEELSDYLPTADKSQRSSST